MEIKMSIAAIQPTPNAMGAVPNNETPSFQKILEQLLLINLSGDNSYFFRVGDQIQQLLQELRTFASTIPLKEGEELQELLKQAPSDTDPITYSTNIRSFLGVITGYIASIMPNGLSPEDKLNLQILLAKHPTDPDDKYYNLEVTEWTARIGSFLASHLFKESSSELEHIMEKMPNDPQSKDYPEEVIKFMAILQVYVTENLPDKISPTQKDRLDQLEEQMRNISPEDPRGPTLLSILDAELQQEISKIFF